VSNPGQQELAGMPARLYPCTPTRLATWQDCPRRYRFSYLDRPQPAKGPPWAHNTIGATVHSALADWFGLPPARRTPLEGARLMRKRWRSEGFRDAAQAERAASRAVGWVRDYLSGLDPALEPAGVERTVTATTRSLVLSGRADRIDRRGGALVIVDYKTGRHLPTDDDARSSLALAVYAVAAARTLRRPCSRVELHHLPSGTRAVAEHADADLEKVVAEAETIGLTASAADAAYRSGAAGDEVFAPRPSARCSWCDFRRHCPEGRAAAPDREPWASVADL
jgi:putative RecB family exonuclease